MQQLRDRLGTPDAAFLFNPETLTKGAKSEERRPILEERQHVGLLREVFQWTCERRQGCDPRVSLLCRKGDSIHDHPADLAPASRVHRRPDNTEFSGEAPSLAPASGCCLASVDIAFSGDIGFVFNRGTISQG